MSETVLQACSRLGVTPELLLKKGARFTHANANRRYKDLAFFEDDGEILHVFELLPEAQSTAIGGGFTTIDECEHCMGTGCSVCGGTGQLVHHWKGS